MEQLKLKKEELNKDDLKRVKNIVLNQEVADTLILDVQNSDGSLTFKPLMRVPSYFTNKEQDGKKPLVLDEKD